VTRQQVAAMVVINAVVSLIISLTVVLTFDRYRAAAPAPVEGLPQPTVQTRDDIGPTATETPVAVAAQPVATYVVKSGDSLSSVAYRFGVSLDALMSANGIDNANYITVGQSLLVPTGGDLPLPTPTPRQLPTLAPLLTPEAGEAPIVIETVVVAERAEDERVTIVNRGAKGIAMEGWTLEDEDGHSYAFPSLFLWRNGTVLVHSGAGSDSATDLYWGLTETVWDVGERAILRDTNGEVVSELAVSGGSAGGG